MLVAYVPSVEEATEACTQGAVDWTLQYYIAKSQGVSEEMFLEHVTNKNLKEFIKNDFQGDENAAIESMDKAILECVNVLRNTKL